MVKNKLFILSNCFLIMFITIFLIPAEAHHHDGMEPEPSPCYNCGGSGVCANCGGSGEVIFERWENGSTVQDVFPCNDCYGTGRCQICYGSGVF